MALYEYKCPECQSRTTVQQHGSRLEIPCVACGFGGPLKRVWNVQIAPVMQAHYNISVGQEISDNKQFERVLREKSDQAWEKTGIPHRFVPVDRSDKKTLGVTEPEDD